MLLRLCEQSPDVRRGRLVVAEVRGREEFEDVASDTGTSKRTH